MFDLQSTSVLVIGGSKGIGRGIASVFAEAGADGAIAARSLIDIDAAVADLDSRGTGMVLGVQADVCGVPGHRGGGLHHRPGHRGRRWSNAARVAGRR